MPEEAQSTDQQTPVKTSHKINWIHILIGVVLGAVLLGAGFGVYLLTQSKGESSVTSTKTSTSSAKQATPSAAATPSAEKDETADWKTFRSENAGVEFRLPSNWTASEIVGGVQVDESKPITINVKPSSGSASLSILKDPNIDWNNPNLVREEQVILDGHKATRLYYGHYQGGNEEQSWIVTTKNLEINGVKYFFSAEWPPGNEEILATLNKILDTLELL